MEETNQSHQGISVEDGALAIEIFLKALTFRPHIPQKVFGEDFAGVSIQQIIPETLEPRVMVLHMGPSGKFPCLFFRFVGTESPLVEAIFTPTKPFCSFYLKPAPIFSGQTHLIAVNRRGNQWHRRKPSR